MDNEIRLLVIEDNAADLETWSRAIERHNASGESAADSIRITLKTAKSLDEANTHLLSMATDAAIIDLRLDDNGPQPDNTSGNDILKHILAHELAVTAVFTGQPTDANVPEYAKDQVRVFTKGAGESEGTNAVLKWLIEQHPLIKCIQAATLTIRKEMATVFNHSIWPRWKLWLADSKDEKQGFLDASVARHITSHVHEILSDKLKGRAHAEEWYFLPPAQGGPRTGDIVKTDSGQIEIVITPRCDFATGKNTTVQLARCENISAEWDKIQTNIKLSEAKISTLSAEATEAERKEAEKELSKHKSKQSEYVNHCNRKNSCHFLPRMKLTEQRTVGPLIVRFDQIRTLEKNSDEIGQNGSTKIFASLSPVFLPSLVERLGSFFSRIGTPDYQHFDDVTPPS